MATAGTKNGVKKSSHYHHPVSDGFDLTFKVFYDLMARRVSEILLVSSPYDAFIMEEDGRLAERIIHEYRGLNLTRPPRLTWVPDTEAAFAVLNRKRFDLVLTMPRVDDMDPYQFAREVKKKYHLVPVFLLTHGGYAVRLPTPDASAIDRHFVWMGNTDLLLALIKNVEDRLNAPFDTRRARVRVIMVVEDSPHYCSSLLPMLYKEIVTQTNAVIEESLNEEHRILRMRARPKIILAQSYEEAFQVYKKYKPYLLSVFSDIRFPVNGVVDGRAGFKLLKAIKAELPSVPLLILSAEEDNREAADGIPAAFVNKNSATLLAEIRQFLQNYLGFGPFVFQLQDGQEIGRAHNIHELEMLLPSIPDESIWHHAVQNHFSRWLMARSEIQLASKLRSADAHDFSGPQEIRTYLVNCLRERRQGRQKGIVTDFIRKKFDPDMDFLKIGKGSLGGKARGIAFVTAMLKSSPAFHQKFPGVVISAPKSLIISTESFDTFMCVNQLKSSALCGYNDQAISDVFLNGEMPERLILDLKRYLMDIQYPLAVRSSSLLEDAQFQARAGIYNTFMLSNNHPQLEVRLKQLMDAIKLVYASTFMETAITFSRSTHQRIEEEKMGVVIQKLTGIQHGPYFFPTLSGVAQSYNFYPISYLRPQEGIVHLALGLGRIVVEGGTAMRFTPRYPQFLPQFSTVNDMLKYSQRMFYALDLNRFPAPLNGTKVCDTLVKLEIDDPRVANAYPVQILCSTYNPNDHQIRDSITADGYRVLTFASILKYNLFPLADLIAELLEMGRKGMGGPVEIEFAANLFPASQQPHEFNLLQVRPMALSQRNILVEISDDDIKNAFCYSNNALGNGLVKEIADIILVDPQQFKPGKTIDIADDINVMNKELEAEQRKYLLIGPGRWGSADRWLGIPVSWNSISGVGAIVEVTLDTLKADPSQGSHFFNNITSLGIAYITVNDAGDSRLDWERLLAYEPRHQTQFLRHIRFKQPLTIKIDGKRSQAVILETEPA